MDKVYCPVCGRELTEIEILFGFEVCRDCLDLDEYLSTDETTEIPAYDTDDEDDVSIYYGNKYDDYKELDFN